MLAGMIDAFLVEVGALCAEPGEQLGTLVEVQRTERFRIAALTPPPPRPPGCSSSALRRRASVGWCAILARAGVQGPDEPALH